jgi:hypothetical protein
MSQDWTDNDLTTDDVPSCINQSDGKLTTLRSNFSGTSAPGSPVEGQLFVDSTTASDLILYFRNNAAWVAVGNLKARAAKDMNDFELENARVENLAADPAASGSKIGRVFYHTSDEKIRFDDGSAIQTLHSGDVTCVKHLPMPDTGCDASNPPTAGTAGTTPTNRGWNFDAANELYSFAVRVPQNWDAASDLYLDLDCVLGQGETDGEDIDWEMDYISIASGEDATKTSTNVTSATEVSATTSAGAMYRCAITFDYNDGDNAVTAGDLIVAEIHRTSLASVGGVVVTGASLRYTGNNAG